MTQMRTILKWLEDLAVNPDAEAWILSDEIVRPITEVYDGMKATSVFGPAIGQKSLPKPLTFKDIRDRLLESPMGNELQWAQYPELVFRGPYVVNPENAVFFVFLPDSIEIQESYAEKIDRRKDEARQLTKEIESSWDS